MSVDSKTRCFLTAIRVHCSRPQSATSHCHALVVNVRWRCGRYGGSQKCRDVRVARLWACGSGKDSASAKRALPARTRDARVTPSPGCVYRVVATPGNVGSIADQCRCAACKCIWACERRQRRRCIGAYQQFDLDRRFAGSFPKRALHAEAASRTDAAATVIRQSCRNSRSSGTRRSIRQCSDRWIARIGTIKSRMAICRQAHSSSIHRSSPTPPVSACCRCRNRKNSPQPSCRPSCSQHGPRVARARIRKRQSGVGRLQSWEGKRKARAQTRCRRHVDKSAGLPDCAVHLRQAQTRALVRAFGGEIGLE